MIILNRAKCLLCGNIVISRHRHDFVTCECGNVSVDGGLQYLRRLYVDNDSFKELSMFSDLPFEEIRNYYYRYNRYTKEYVNLCDMSNAWLENIITYLIERSATNNIYFRLFIEEKLYRTEQEIYVADIN